MPLGGIHLQYKIGFPFSQSFQKKACDIANNIFLSEVAFQFFELTPESVGNQDILHEAFTALG